MNWWHRAACIDQDLNVFFPQEGKTGRPSNGYKKFCRGCPVAEECLKDAMKYEPDADGKRHGIRGGMTPSQRSRLAAGIQPLRLVS